MIRKYVAHSLSEYLKIVADIALREKATMWFRGHSDAHHQLTPSVLRGWKPLTDARGYELREGQVIRSGGGAVTGPSPEAMLDEFKRRALPFLQREPRNDFEWLFLMQHHGAPTRLLDWTTNAIVALYFAAEHASPTADEDEDANLPENGFAVFAIDPRKINKLTQRIDHPVDVAADYDRWKAFARPTESEPTKECDTFLPICILAPHIAPRIRAQSGTFTLHGANVWPLDYYTALRPHIHKVFFPATLAEQVRVQLTQAGVTPSFIYPDLDGVARDVREAELRRFNAWWAARNTLMRKKDRKKAKRK